SAFLKPLTADPSGLNTRLRGFTGGGISGRCLEQVAGGLFSPPAFEAVLVGIFVVGRKTLPRHPFERLFERREPGIGFNEPVVDEGAVNLGDGVEAVPEDLRAADDEHFVVPAGSDRLVDAVV